MTPSNVKILEVVLRVSEPGGLVPGIRVTGYIESRTDEYVDASLSLLDL